MIQKYKKYILLGGAFISLIFFIILYFKDNKNDEVLAMENKSIIDTTKIPETTKENFYVDIKGAVKKPGVYEFSSEDKVIDAINKAGGLTKNGVTSNINLSMKLKSEMVIYIFTKNELTTTSAKNNITNITTIPCRCETIEVNNCINPTTSINSDSKDIIENNQQNDNSLININLATIDELTNLSGIGESKAKAIIDYRNQNGGFKTIEDIKNVSGLGDALFAKIKDFITV